MDSLYLLLPFVPLNFWIQFQSRRGCTHAVDSIFYLQLLAFVPLNFWLRIVNGELRAASYFPPFFTGAGNSLLNVIYVELFRVLLLRQQVEFPTSLPLSIFSLELHALLFA